jgi:arabinan endo-1,5-alpha-L-arabinosidase
MKLKNILLLMSGILAISGCGSSGDKKGVPENTVPVNVSLADPTATASAIVYNDMAVHDPSIIKADDGTFYVFGSHLSVAKSTDLMKWTRVAEGVNDQNPLFNTFSAQIADGISWTGETGSWAPDVIKLKDGKYYFYYDHCGNFGAGCNAPRSYIGVAVSSNIEGPYVDKGIFMRSGMNTAEIANGKGPDGVTSYNGTLMPNAIDPHIFFDKGGKLWMVYGSYFGGIFIVELDATTGKAKAGQGYGKHLAGGGFAPIEGTWITYSPETDYYYMFNSIAGFAAADGYNIRVSRSKTPDGTYLDAAGNDMLLAKNNTETLSKYGVKLMGGFNFVAEKGDTAPGWGYLSPGHNSVYYDEAAKKYFLVTHTRFPNRGEEHSVRVHEMWMNADGWLVASPQRYAPIAGTNVVDAVDLQGDYRFINHDKDSNGTGHNSVYIRLNDDRTVTGEVTGYYRLSDTDNKRITLILGGKTYEGVMAWQWDESLRKLMPSFSAVSTEGVSVWGSKLPTKSTSEVLADVGSSLSVISAIKAGAISLPTRGTHATKIVWSSSKESVIKTDGTVIRPNAGDGDQVVTLTATMTLDGVITTKSFNVTVPQRPKFNRIANFMFENNLSESLGNFGAGSATGDRIFNTGTVSYVAGKEGQAVNLDGHSGVLLPEGVISNYEYTVSFWIKPTVITGFTPAFFGTVDEKLDANNIPYSDTWVSYLPQSWNGGTMLWGRVANWFDGIAGLKIPEGQWTHMAFSVNQGLASIYINGEKKFSGGNFGDLFSGKKGKFALGVNYWDLPFNGAIDELKIYEASLTAAEVKALDIDKLPTSDLLTSAAAVLDLGNISALRSDIALPVTGPYASAIKWTSSNPTVLSTAGKVTQPGREATDANVTLTATISLEGKATTKTFVATVKSKAPPTPVAVYGFEDNLNEKTGKFGAGIVIGAKIDVAGGNVSYVAGAVGKALVLDGSSGVKLANNLIKDHSYTISLWLNPTAVSQYTPAFFGWATDSSWISIVPRGPGDAQNTMLWSGTAWFDGNFGAKIPVGAWSHLVMVVDNGKLTTYLNGVATATLSNFPDVFTPAAITQFALGVNYWDMPYNGKIDELKIFDEAIVADDAKALFTEGTPK